MKKLALLVVALLPGSAVAGDWYAFLEGGVLWSLDRSNNDEVEFGNEPGGSIAVGAGYGFRLADRWLLNAEGQVIGQTVPLHGRNDRGEETADGKYFSLLGFTANVWPEYRLSDRWSIYAGGGTGPSVVWAFGSSAFTWMVIGGAGVRVKATDALSIDVSGRYYWTAPVDVNGAQSRYDSFGPVFRLLWAFR